MRVWCCPRGSRRAPFCLQRLVWRWRSCLKMEGGRTSKEFWDLVGLQLTSSRSQCTIQVGIFRTVSGLAAPRVQMSQCEVYESDPILFIAGLTWKIFPPDPDAIFSGGCVSSALLPLESSLSSVDGAVTRMAGSAEAVEATAEADMSRGFSANGGWRSSWHMALSLWSRVFKSAWRRSRCMVVGFNHPYGMMNLSVCV